MEWVHRRHRALEEQRLCLYAQTIQPPAENSDGEHYEVLLRLRDGKVIWLPIAFLPAAERATLMPQIDRWWSLQRHARWRPVTWARTKPQLGLCAINLSGASINDEQFLDFLRDTPRNSPVPTTSPCLKSPKPARLPAGFRVARMVSELRAGLPFCPRRLCTSMSSFAYSSTCRWIT